MESQMGPSRMFKGAIVDFLEEQHADLQTRDEGEQGRRFGCRDPPRGTVWHCDLSEDNCEVSQV